MFSEEVRKLLAEVITSWQVLAVTGVLILYISLVNYVAALHHRHRQLPIPKVKRAKPETPEVSGSSEDTAASAASANSEVDELGLEEK